MTAYDPALSATTLEPSVPQAGARHVPLYQFAALNLPGVALLGIAWHRGWLDNLVAVDPTRLTLVIVAVFAVGMLLAVHRLWRIDHELDCIRSFNPPADAWARRYRDEVRGRSSGSRSIAASTLRIRVTDYIAVIRHVAGSLVLLGLIGTVVGFIVALSGVDPDKAADVNSMTSMVATLIQGMSVALYTTLAGAVANLWLMVNYRLVASAAVRLLTDLVAIGEHDARP